MNCALAGIAVIKYGELPAIVYFVLIRRLVLRDHSHSFILGASTMLLLLLVSTSSIAMLLIQTFPLVLVRFEIAETALLDERHALEIISDVKKEKWSRFDFWLFGGWTAVIRYFCEHDGFNW